MDTSIVEEHERTTTLPYATEYAKSGRSQCRKCKKNISEGSLRMAVMEKSHHFDGVEARWFHFACFWPYLKGEPINERSIRGMDWLKWEDQERIREHMKKNNGGEKSTVFEFARFKAEYAKTNRGRCATCLNSIGKNSVKIQFTNSFHHFDCLAQKGAIEGKPEDMRDFDNLKDEDKKKFQEFLVAQAAEESKDVKTAVDIEEGARASSSKDCALAPAPAKKARMVTDKKLMEKLKKQTELLWQIREKFKTLKKNDLVDLLESNDIQVPAGEDKILDRLCDAALFGKPAPCPKCPDGQMVFSSTAQTYVCMGHLTEWMKCTYKNANPIRTPIGITREQVERMPVLRSIAFSSLPSRVYSEGADIVAGKGRVAMLQEKMAVEGFDNQIKFVGQGRQLIKRGTVVDGECSVAEFSHVYRDEKGELYSIALGLTDTASNKNSYYKMQLLENDDGGLWYLFRSWGRVGTGVGGVTTDNYHNVESAIKEFEKHFKEKSGNDWADRKYFRKKPGKMCLIEMDYSEVEKKAGQSGNVIPSTLPAPIQKLIRMIFDVDKMKQALQGIELDMQQMPLGKLSRKQLMQAFSVLSELQRLMESQQVDQDRVVDASNRFYSLVPHSFGMQAPPKLDSLDQIKKKTAMVEDLMDIALAYKVLREGEDSVPLNMDLVDANYLKLKSQIAVVSRDSLEFNMINTYTANTHGLTHDVYDLEIIDVLRVARDGEEAKFMKHLGNRMLLWHGSGTPNFCGILSQGLRIAPPEAPVTGYMFGKGVYFADMVSKSANYCRAQIGQELLLLLCDVALGTSIQYQQACNPVPLPAGYHSVKGTGAYFPNPQQSWTSPEGYTVPYGKTTYTPRVNLWYNEYIVYNVNQICIRYLVKMKMNPKHKKK